MYIVVEVWRYHDATPPPRVPLLPRQPPPDPQEDKGSKKKSVVATVSPLPPTEDISSLEVDQQLIVHAYSTAIAAARTMVSQ